MVVMATEEMRQRASINGRPCVTIRIIKKSDANAVRVVTTVKNAMTDLGRFLSGELGRTVLLKKLWPSSKRAGLQCY